MTPEELAELGFQQNGTKYSLIKNGKIVEFSNGAFSIQHVPVLQVESHEHLVELLTALRML